MKKELYLVLKNGGAWKTVFTIGWGESNFEWNYYLQYKQFQFVDSMLFVRLNQQFFGRCRNEIFFSGQDRSALQEKLACTPIYAPVTWKAIKKNELHNRNRLINYEYGITSDNRKKKQKLQTDVKVCIKFEQ